MNGVIQIIVRFHHVYQRIRPRLVDIVNSADDTEMATGRIGNGIVLNDTGTSSYIDILANLRTFPGLVNPKRSHLFAGILVSDISLRIKVKYLVTGKRVVGLDLVNLPLGLPPYAKHTNIACNIIRQKVRADTAVQSAYSIEDITDRGVIVNDNTILADNGMRRNEPVRLVIIASSAKRALSVKIRKLVAEPFDILRS